MVDLPTPDPAGQAALSDAEFERQLARPAVRAIIADLEQRGVFQRQAQNEQIEAAGGTDFICEECSEPAWPLRWGDRRLCARHYGYEEGFAEADEWRDQLEREEHSSAPQATIPPIPLPPPPTPLTLIRRLTHSIRRPGRPPGVSTHPDFLRRLLGIAHSHINEHDRQIDAQAAASTLGISYTTLNRRLQSLCLMWSDIEIAASFGSLREGLDSLDSLQQERREEQSRDRKEGDSDAHHHRSTS